MSSLLGLGVWTTGMGFPTEGRGREKHEADSSVGIDLLYRPLCITRMLTIRSLLGLILCALVYHETRKQPRRYHFRQSFRNCPDL